MLLQIKDGPCVVLSPINSLTNRTSLYQNQESITGTQHHLDQEKTHLHDFYFEHTIYICDYKTSFVERPHQLVAMFVLNQNKHGKQGSKDGAVVRALASHPCGPGSIPGLSVICGLCLLLVLVLAPRGFSLDTPVFPSPQKPTLLNSNSIWKVSPISALR